MFIFQRSIRICYARTVIVMFIIEKYAFATTTTHMKQINKSLLKNKCRIDTLTNVFLTYRM